MHKSFTLKAGDIQKDWMLIDAQGVILGRLAAHIAHCLRGKHKPIFTQHLDCGDYIIVINADKVALSGRKETQKTYYRHTGYPGGIKTTKANQLRQKKPDALLRKAVKNMLPGGPLSSQQLSHLYIYAGENHPHQSQNPKLIDFASRNQHNRLVRQDNPQ